MRFSIIEYASDRELKEQKKQCNDLIDGGVADDSLIAVSEVLKQVLNEFKNRGLK